MPRKPNRASSAIFATRLRVAMAAKSITQQAMGEQTGRTRQAISQYCNGLASPDWETIAAMAKYLNVSSDYLLGLSDTPIISSDKDDAYRYGWQVGYDCCLKELSVYLHERGSWKK